MDGAGAALAPDIRPAWAESDRLDEWTPVTELQDRAATATLAPTPEAAPPNRAALALLLGAFVAVGPLTIDMYLPALPTITAELGTTSAIGQLVLGPLSDAFGRRGPLLAGTALYVVASLLVLVAPSIEVLGVLRLLQGVGTAAGAVVAMAVVRDLFTGRAAATMLSRLFLVLGAAPVLAPTLGGELLRVTSWRGIFAVLAGYGLLLLAVGAGALRETLPPSRRSGRGVAGTLRTYRGLLRDRTFVGLVLVAGVAVGAVAGAVLLVLAVTGTGGLPGVVVPLWAMLFASGLALPNAPALALSRHGESAGSAAALLGAVQFGVGAAVSPVVGLLGNDAAAMGTVILAALVLAIGVLVTVVRPWQLTDAPEEPALAGG